MIRVDGEHVGSGDCEVPVDLVEDGVLWLINRVVFHPRGFALAIDPTDRTYTLCGDGTEPWRFDTIYPQDDQFAALEALLDRARLANR